MVPNPLRFFRILEILIPGAIAAAGIAIYASPRRPLGVAVGFWAFAAFAVLMFELRFLGHRRTTARVRRGLEEVAKRDLDAPSPVTQRGSDDFIEELAANRAIAGMMARRSSRVCVAGKWRGRDVEIGTAVVAGRDFDQKISYVCVLDRRVPGPFRVMTRGALTSFSRMGMDKHPVAMDDPAFDAKWVVDADEGIARTVLDPTTRAKLLELQAQLSWMEVASIEATRFGLIVRWPGELSPDSAAYLRDLAFAVHDRIAAPA